MPWIESATIRDPQRVLFHTFSTFSQVGDVAGSVGNRPNAAAAWPTLDRIIYCPVRVELPCTVKKLAIYSAVQNASSMIDVALHNESGAVLTSAGLTAMAAAGIQSFDVADVSILPGIYVLSMVVDSTVATATFFRAAVNAALLDAAGAGIMDVSASTAIGTLTYTAPASSYMPLIAAGGAIL